MNLQQLNDQLIEACGNLNYQEASRLLDAEANPNAVDKDNSNSALTTLIYNSFNCFAEDRENNRNDFWKFAELLLEHGADVNKIMKADDGCINTALFTSQYSVPEVIEFLLCRGADPDVINEEEETVLDAIEFSQYAEYDGMVEDDTDYWRANNMRMRKILLNHGAHRASTLSHIKESESWSTDKRAIYNACWHLQAESLDRLLEERQITLPNEFFPRLLYETIEIAPEFRQKDFINDANGYEQQLIATLMILQKHGEDLNDPNGNALYYAVRAGYLKTVLFLVDAGADPIKTNCGYWNESFKDLPEHRHYYTLADKVLHWRGRWDKETALAFQKMFSSRIIKTN